MRQAKNACLTEASAGKHRLASTRGGHEASKKQMLRYLKQIWIAYHAPGMTAMLQLCYHKGASMACALQRIAAKHRTDAASGMQSAHA